MQAAVRNYIDALSSDSRDRVSKLFAREIDEFALLTAKLVSALQRFHARHPAFEGDSPTHIAFSLMTKSANALMAGFELVLTGYSGESEVLFRTALERSAVAWDVVHNPDRFASWKNNKKFDSTESISRLKREVEPVGRLYGYLSNLYVHITPQSSLPSMILEDDTPKFFGYLSPGKEHLPKGRIYFALFCAYVLLQLTEIVFHAYCDELETIERLQGKDLVQNIVSKRHQEFVDAALSHFRLMAGDPTATLG